ncbi:GNAT family N-acetyltransferase [Jeotgalibacillus sp. ET6]|uniref:GNAT family N-acetyltransferase n=1 Tax=Jeotgalibacillus sp. ET6 TaxID=3037260 RepID=UPI0024189365|nr:GNAT family N-acetyltransferase [Jeotgalibacillus sp. ET6]MDG5471875.1 GNAT family N-acetyltransferase [Jeotgalibacillus sp. ET6]
MNEKTEECHPLLKAQSITLRPILKMDVPLLTKWLSNPDVLHFYEGRDRLFNEEEILRKFFRELGNEAKCIIEYNDCRIGYLQFYELDSGTKSSYGYFNEELIVGMDQYIGETHYWNKGIGTGIIEAVSDYLFLHKRADRVVMDPHVSNLRALHVYEKCGFQKVKLLERHEWHEGEYRDCWLMEKRRSENG